MIFSGVRIEIDYRSGEVFLQDLDDKWYTLRAAHTEGFMLQRVVRPKHLLQLGSFGPFYEDPDPKAAMDKEVNLATRQYKKTDSPTTPIPATTCRWCHGTREYTSPVTGLQSKCLECL